MASLSRYLRWLDIFGVLDRTRASRQAALLTLLAIAVEKQLPLSPMLDAFAADSPARWRRDLRDLADMLQSGAALPDALEAVPNLLPPEAILAARVGAESGTLAESLRVVSRRAGSGAAVAVVWPHWAALYFAFIPLVLVLIVSFLMFAIVPKLKRIFEDFAVELPPPTIALITISDWVLQYWFVVLPPIVVFVGLTALIIINGGRFIYPLDSPPRVLLQRFPRFAAPDILRNLAPVAGAGRPLLGALETMAGFHPVLAARRRMAEIADSVAAGHDCWTAMTAAGMIRTGEASLLSAAERVGNLQWALAEVAQNIERQLEFRFKVVLEFVRPAVVLLLGSAVGFVVVSLFLPLVGLINDLAG